MGKVWNIVSRVNDTLDRLQSTSMLNPNRSTNIIGLDANGHIGYTRDPGTNLWSPGGADAIGAFGPENEITMGKIFCRFLERSNFDAINTFFDTGKTFYTRSGSMARIDYLCTTSSAFGGGRCSKTSVMNRRGDICQNIVSRYRRGRFSAGTRLLTELKYQNKQNAVNIDRDNLASSVERGGTQASTFGRLVAEWANTNLSNWTDNYMNNTLGKQYELLIDGVGNATKNTFEKETENATLSKELTSRRLQLLKIRKDAVTNWVRYADNDNTYNIRRELKACDRRLRALAND